MSRRIAMLVEPLARENTRYDQDLCAWSREQARWVREGRFDRLDIENVAEEIESVGGSARSELRSRLTTLVEHLLKLEASSAPDPRRGWRRTVIRSRAGIADLLDESPSLRGELKRLLSRIQPETARFTADLLEDAGDTSAAVAVRMQEGGFTDDELFGDWFPGGPSDAG